MAKQFDVKNAKVNGKDVKVHTVQIDGTETPVLHVKAVVGNTEYTEAITFGPVGAPGASNYTAEHMQADLDKHREKCANIAEFRDRVHSFVGSLK